MTLWNRILIRATCALIVIGASPPVLEILLKPLLPRFPGPVLSAILFPIIFVFSIWGFLDYAVGKVICVILAICVILVLVSPGIKWWIKIDIAGSAGITFYAVLHWVQRLSHGW
jgi:hypothetical protein